MRFRFPVATTSAVTAGNSKPLLILSLIGLDKVEHVYVKIWIIVFEVKNLENSDTYSAGTLRKR